MAYAQLERGILRERVRAGMERARWEGRRIGRPPTLSRPGMLHRFQEIQPQILTGAISKKKAARVLGIGRATRDRLLAASVSRR